MKDVLGLIYLIRKFMLRDMGKSNDGMQFIKDAVTARESDNQLEALKLSDEALIVFQAQGDLDGYIEVFRARAHDYKHLALKTHDKVLGRLWETYLKLALEVATEHQLSKHLSLIYFDLAEVAMFLGQGEEAEQMHRKGLELDREGGADRGRKLYHLGAVVYLNGKKEEGKKLLLDGISMMREHEEELEPFVAHVWISGGLMKLAEVLREDEPREARKYLEEAKEIIEADPKLVIRKRQLAEVEMKFG